MDTGKTVVVLIEAVVPRTLTTEDFVTSVVAKNSTSDSTLLVNWAGLSYRFLKEEPHKKVLTLDRAISV